MIKRPVILTGLILVLFSLDAVAVKIENVFHDPVNANKLKVRFNLTEPATAKLNIYDDRDYLIRSIENKKLSSGDQAIVWDLKDSKGIAVPAEAYRYTIAVVNSRGDKAVHDLSDLTGNTSLKVSNANFNPETGKVEFVLKKSARVLLRAGLSDGGPLLVTVTNWVAFNAGMHTIEWNGMDASGVIDISSHKRLYLDVQAYVLSDNTIIVGKNTNSVNLIDVSSSKTTKREIVKSTKKKMFAAYQQTSETRGDYLVRLAIPEKYERKAGVPIVSGIVPIQLILNSENIETAINRRAEPVFYIDGHFSYENEVGFYPMTWKLDTRELDEGEHYLTVNLRGYEGNFGIASAKIIVNHANEAN